MNTKAAAKLIAESGLKLLRWGPSFKTALVKLPDGTDVWLYNDGGREKVANNIAKLGAGQPSV